MDAEWIGGPAQVYCRHTFTVAERPVAAILRVVADPHTYAIKYWQAPPGEFKYEQWLLGGSFIKYRIFANGEPVAVGPFRPIQDGVPVLQEYDITAALVRGRNALAVLSRGERSGFALALELKLADGRLKRIVSGRHWKQREADSVHRPVCWECPAIDQYFKGSPGPGEYQEHLDGTAYPQGWKTPGFDDRAWCAAEPYGGVEPPLEICRTPPYQVARIEPQWIRPLPGGNYLIDFGRAVFGSIELACPRGGGTIELRLAEELTEDGHARYQLRAPVCYQERWTFAEGSEPLSHLGVRMFRYAEVVGWPGEMTNESIRALAIAPPFDAGRSMMSCSEPRLEQVWQLSKNSVAFTLADLYTDCLTRERLAYEADAYVTMLTHFCTEGSSASARRTLAYLVGHPTWPCEWRACLVPAFYEYVLHSGDVDFLDRHYTFLKEKSSFHRLMANGLVRRFPMQCTVDWPPVYRDGYEFGEANAVANAFQYWNLGLLQQMAGWLGRDSDVREFKSAALELKAAFNRELIDDETGLYVDSVGSRHSAMHTNLYALRFGLVAPDGVEACMDFVQSRGMACSVFTAQFLLETLFMLGRPEEAVRLMVRSGDRSWMDMIERGATVTTECWTSDMKADMSWAHPWGSAPGNVVARWLFGLRPTAPGWREFVFQPRPGGIESGRLTLATPRGTFDASFSQWGAISKCELRSDREPGPSLELTLPARVGGKATRGLERVGGAPTARDPARR